MTSIDYTAEELEKLAELIRKYYQELSKLQQQERKPLFIDEKLLNLDYLSFPALGLSNPIGQIADFIAQQLQDLLKGIASLINTATKPIRDVLSNAVTLIQNIQSGVGYTLTALGNLSVQIANLPATIANAFSWVGVLVNALIQAVSVLSKIPEALSQIVTTITNLPTLFGRLINSFIGAIENLYKAFQNAVSVIANLPNILSQIGSSIVNALLSIPNLVQSVITALSNIPNAFNQIGTAIVNALSAIPNFLNTSISILSNIPNLLSQIGSTIVNVLLSLPNLFNQFVSILSNIPNLLQQVINTLFSLPDIFNKFVSIIGNIPSLLTQIGGAIYNALISLPNLFNQFVSILSNITNFIFEAGRFLYNLATQAGSVIANFGQQVWNFFLTIGQTFQNFFSNIAQFFVNLGSGFFNLVQQAQGLFSNIINTFDSFIKQAENFIKEILNIPNKLLESAKKLLPQGMEKTLSDTFGSLINCLAEPSKCLFGMALNIASIILSSLDKIKDFLINLGGRVINIIGDFINTIFSTISNFVKSILEKLVTGAIIFGYGLRQIFEKVVEPLINFFLSVFKLDNIILGISAVVPFALQARAVNITQTIARLVPVFERLLRLLMIPSLISAITTGGRVVLDALSSLCNKFEVVLEPLGVGTRYTFNCRALLKSISRFLYANLLGLLKDAAKFVKRGFLEMIGFAFGFHFLRVFNFLFVDAIGTVLPYFQFSLSEAADMHKRLVVFNNITELSRIKSPEGVANYDFVYDKLDTVLKMEGYPYYLRQFAIGKLTDFHVVILDRFGNQRQIPIAKGYELPSPSEITRMMIRDLFNSPEDFFALGGLRGMPRDVLLQYYIFHFRYPSPEKIIEFYMRGLAGNLFSTRVSIELDETERRWLAQLKAPQPVAPAELMNRPDVLAQLLRTYLRWHDYFYAAWSNGFTSDRAIIFETIFDLPLRVDVRWMYKWSVFSGIVTKHGISKLTELAPRMFSNYRTAQAFATFTADNPEAFDVLQLGRIAIARSLHPEWVPFVTLSEALEVITDERTLVRTDVMNIYEWGFYDINKVTNIFSNLMEVYYKVPVYDEETNMFKVTDVTVPIRYRETEIKMLGIRAITKRYLDFAREFVRDLEYAYRENIIPTKEEIERRLSIADIVNEVRNALSGKITDTELKNIENIITNRSKELEFILSFENRQKLALDLIKAVVDTLNESIKKELETLNANAKSAKVLADLTATLDLSFWQARLKLFEIDRTKRIYERMRLWMYWMVWSYFIYMQQGLVDYQTAINRILDIITSLKLTDVELKFLLRYALDVLAGTQKGKAPTPNQLANFADVLSFDPKLIDFILDAQNVKYEPIKKLWTAYIAIKPFLSELNTLRTALITAYVNGAIKEWKEVEDTLRRVEQEVKASLPIPEETKAIITVFNDTTLKVLKAIADTRRITRFEPETLLTPSTAITFLEYVPEAWRLLVEETKHIKMPTVFREFWETYVRRRITRRAYDRLITEWVNAIELGVLTPEENTKIVEMLKNNGFYDEELEVFRLIADLRSRRRFGFTISQLIQILEYVPEAEQVVISLATGLAKDPRLNSIVATYIHRRTIASEINRYVTSALTYLSRSLDSRDPELQRFSKALEELGTLKEEREWIEATLDVRRKQTVLNVFVPSFNSLIANSRYTPLAQQLYLWKLEKEIDLVTVSRLYGSDFANLLRQYYLQLLINRAVATEINALVVQYRNLVSYDMLLPEIEKNIIDTLTRYGVSQDRLQLIRLVAQLSRLARLGTTKETYMRLTVTRLTNLIERVPDAKDFALQYLASLNLPPNIYNIYLKYIDASIGLSEFRRLLTYFHTLFSTIRLSASDRKTFEELAKIFGYTGRKLDLYYKSLQLRRIRYILVTLIPSLTALTGYARYTTKAFDLLKFKLDYFVDRQELLTLFGESLGNQLYQLLLDFFTQMAIARAVRSELNNAITALVNAYSVGAITTQQLEQELQNLKKYGLSDMQIELIKLRAKYLAIYRAALRGIA